LNILEVNDFRHTEIHTPEPLVTEVCTVEFELATEKTKRQKSTSIVQTPTEIIKAGGRNNSL